MTEMRIRTDPDVTSPRCHSRETPPLGIEGVYAPGLPRAAFVGLFRYRVVCKERPFSAHSREFTGDYAVLQHHQEVPAGKEKGAEFASAEAARHVGSVCGEGVRSGGGGATQITQGAVHGQADTFRSGEVWLRPMLRKGCSLCVASEDRSATRSDNNRAGTFVRLVFRPGQAFQYDWSENWSGVRGERIKLQVAHIILSHSRALLVRAYLLQTHEMLP